MLFAEEDEGHLKAWIVKRLANTSDADSDVLADYVLALLRHDSDQATIRKLFESEIPDFLSDDSAAFTNDVFQAINYKSYLPGAPPAPPAGLAPTAAPFVSQAQKSSTASRKRRVSDRDEDDVDIILHDAPGRGGAPAQKLQKTGSDFQNNGALGNGGSGQTNGLYGQPGYGSMPNFGPGNGFGTNTQAFPPIDPAMILQNIQMLQQMGIPIPDPTAFATPGQQKSSRKKKKRCRDYDKKGFCARGHKCKWEHGNESVFLPSFMPPPPPAGDAALDYDPNSPAMAMAAMFGPQGMNFRNGQPHDRTTQANGHDSKKSKKQKGKPSVAVVNGPVHDRSRTKIVVQNIPKENLSEEQVRDFFSQFGPISEITIQEHRRLAVLNFETWEAANAAWSSPKVIFDNRFVKVFWQKDEADTVSGKDENNASEEADFDLDAFIQKQEEAQRIHEEKMKRRKELEKERQDLEDRRKRHLAEKRELDAKLRSASPSAHSERKSSAQTEALRAQLAALEAEADLLGIDPDAVQEDSQPWSGRGGRGRGGYRGRGAWRGGYAPRGGRGGGGPGAIEARHAAYAQYSLDLRPKVVIVSGADFTLPSNDESLRQYLFSVGEFESIRAEPEATHITFKDRKTAEQFMSGLASSDNTLAGVDEKLELAWGQNLTPAAAAASRQQAAGSAAKTDGDDAGSEAGGSEDGEIQDDGDGDHGMDGDFGMGHGRDQGDMDYDAGDDWIS
ncbi:uncharacterized protein B0I36DRAFT_122718 [Microdochium trichocladiopsis]|uniref:CCCH zinc finger and RRM domain-containing protein n=1 Tax=Microdochium trichocladiopsis TaxID=1682393 RepID=A0A9P8Y6Z9_9PEZI|nr:uncharacterized protein B0I36DRAFT_122718 [Microdochium trichocladiopsis]KAH7031419.1 hypothetical protein B0I36DRAFT_122718 [Microdochium trichocladiopsis]